MGYKLDIRPLATIDTLEAYDWYESQKHGLGLDFLNELENFYDSILRNPFTYSYTDIPVRQGKIKRFPYLVVYEVSDEKLIIFSVFMAKQNPDKKRTM